MKTVVTKYVVGLVSVLVYAAICQRAEGTELIDNGGFEHGTGDHPLAWSVAVAPADGASSLWDNEIAHSGLRSVKLSTTKPYSTEPFNNWYQNIEKPLGGKTIKLKGFIKGRAVQDASFWIQCYQLGSAVPVAVATSNTDTSPTGDFGWTEQTVKLDAPQGTSLVSVRCVLVGSGSAWFDDVTVEVEEKSSTPAPRSVSSHSPVISIPDIKARLDEIKKDNDTLRQSYEKLDAKLDQIVGQMNALRESIKSKTTAKPSTRGTAMPPPFIIPARNAVPRPRTGKLPTD